MSIHVLQTKYLSWPISGQVRINVSEKTSVKYQNWPILCCKKKHCFRPSLPYDLEDAASIAIGESLYLFGGWLHGIDKVFWPAFSRNDVPCICYEP